MAVICNDCDGFIDKNAQSACTCDEDRKSLELRNGLAKAIARELIEQMATRFRMVTVNVAEVEGATGDYETFIVLVDPKD